MLGQLDGLQVVKKEGDFPLLAGVRDNFLAGFPRPIPLVSSRRQRHADVDGEIVKVCEQTKRSRGTRVGSLQSVRKLKPTR